MIFLRLTARCTTSSASGTSSILFSWMRRTGGANRIGKLSGSADHRGPDDIASFLHPSMLISFPHPSMLISFTRTGTSSNKRSLCSDGIPKHPLKCSRARRLHRCLSHDPGLSVIPSKLCTCQKSVNNRMPGHACDPLLTSPPHDWKTADSNKLIQGKGAP